MGVVIVAEYRDNRFRRSGKQYLPTSGATEKPGGGDGQRDGGEPAGDRTTFRTHGI